VEQPIGPPRRHQQSLMMSHKRPPLPILSGNTKSLTSILSRMVRYMLREGPFPSLPNDRTAGGDPRVVGFDGHCEDVCLWGSTWVRRWAKLLASFAAWG
jgi:hypothetical protein